MSRNTDHDIGDPASPSDSESDEPARQKKEEKSIRQFLVGLQRSAYRKLPSLVPDPDHKQRLREVRIRDDQENAKTQPPSDETIDLRCIWAVEFYTPSHTSGLIRSLQELDWNTDLSGIHSNPSSWIQRQRESVLSAGWLNLGILRRPDEVRPLDLSRPTPLPHGIDYAIGHMSSITSSITCIIICFVLDESLNTRYQEALKKNHQTQRVPFRRSAYKILGPNLQKAADIQAIRAEVRDTVSGWFRTHLPGLFATQNDLGTHPSCEFLTLSKTEPLPKQDEGHSHWLRLLNLGVEFDTWEARSVKGLRFLNRVRFEKYQHLHSILAANENTFSAEVISPYRPSERGSILAFVDSHLHGLLTHWALVGLLAAYERYLSRIRDSLSVEPQENEKPLKQFSNLTQYFSLSIDISAVAVELRRLAKDEQSLKWNCEDFLPCSQPYQQETKITLAEAIRNHIQHRADWLANVDKSLRSVLIQYGDALGIHENVRLQRRVALLTLVIAGLTIVIAALTALTFLR